MKKQAAPKKVKEPPKPLSEELEAVLQANLKKIPERDRRSYERGFRGHR